MERLRVRSADILPTAELALQSIHDIQKTRGRDIHHGGAVRHHARKSFAYSLDILMI